MKIIKPNCELCMHHKVCTYVEDMNEGAELCEDEDDPFVATIKCTAFAYDREAAKEALYSKADAAEQNDYVPTVRRPFNPYARCEFTFESVDEKNAFFRFIRNILDTRGSIRVFDLYTFNDEWFAARGDYLATQYGWNGMPINEAAIGEYNKVIFSNPKRLD